MGELSSVRGSVEALLEDVRGLIVDAQRQTAAAVNVGLTALYWSIGKRIRTEVLHDARGTYGEQIVAMLSRQLVAEFGRGYMEKTLRRAIQFADAFPDEAIVATLWRQLSWSHFRELLPLTQPFQREFYAEMCCIERWSVRTLHERIGSMLYERAALSKQPHSLIRQELETLRDKGEVTPNLLPKDPYVLDFLGSSNRFSNGISKKPSCENLKRFFWSWEQASPSWPVKSVFSSTVTTLNRSPVLQPAAQTAGGRRVEAG
ncbi:DUF1016 N-terminal domain-containing protein [Granulicella arctica]|nr:DUF1016 N-terminal domain-containing protein [Granulicella arctica]